MKKVKRIGLLLLVSIFILPLLGGTAVIAANSIEVDNMVDEANLLSQEEVDEIDAMLVNMKQKYDMDVVIYTTNRSSADKSIVDFADDIYDYNNRGCGPNKDGIIFVIDMEQREWQISTTGYGITAFTDYGLEVIEDKIVPYLSDGNYYKAFYEFADLSENYIKAAKDGKAYDNGNKYKEFSLLPYLVVAVVSLVIAAITTISMKSQLKSVRYGGDASRFSKQGAMNITKSQDIFLYHRISKRKKPENSSNGGSSTHRSSSGTSHGGRGGKF